MKKNTDVIFNYSVDNVLAQINRDTLERSVNPYYVLDKDGRILYANPAANKTLGYSREHLQSLTVQDIDVKIALSAWQDLFEQFTGGLSTGLESVHRRCDGSEFPVSVSVTVLTDGNENYICACASDITVYKKDIRQMEQLKFAVENATDAVFLTSPDGEIFYVNTSACDQLGYSMDELIGMNVGDINPTITPEIRAWVRQHEDRGELRTFETIHQRKDGSTFPVELAFNFEFNRGQGFSVTFARDITERKAIARQTEELKFAIENANDAVYLNDRDGNIYYVNRSACEQLGYSYTELTNMNIADIDTSFSVNKLHEFLEQGHTPEETPPNPRHRRKDGSTFPVDVSFNSRVYDGVEYFCSFVRDITEQKKASRRTEELRSAVENAVDAVYLFDINGRLLYVNKSACDTLGYSQEELTSMGVSNIVPNFNRDDLPYILHKLRTEKSMAFESFHQKKDGSTIPVEVTVKLDTFETEEYICAIARDITQRKKTEGELSRYREQLEEEVESRTRELKTAQEELIQKERLAVLGRLTGVVSHELRNPLGTIRSSLYVLHNNISEDNGPIARAISRAERNIVRCDRIIDELLDYTRSRPPELEPVKIDKWLADVTNEYEFPATVSIERHLEAGVMLMIEPERMRRCIINLISNACEALQENPEGVPGVIHVTTWTDDNNVCIEIRDNGPGIPLELREKVFEPLFSTKGFGVGLGLAIVEQIMNQHNGRVEISSGRDGGTSVLLRLPKQ